MTFLKGAFSILLYGVRHDLLAISSWSQVAHSRYEILVGAHRRLSLQVWLKLLRGAHTLQLTSAATLARALRVLAAAMLLTCGCLLGWLVLNRSVYTNFGWRFGQFAGQMHGRGVTFTVGCVGGTRFSFVGEAMPRGFATVALLATLGLIANHRRRRFLV